MNADKGGMNADEGRVMGVVHLGTAVEMATQTFLALSAFIPHLSAFICVQSLSPAEAAAAE
jgi:hypothetical protein